MIQDTNAYKQQVNENQLLRNRSVVIPDQVYMQLPNITLELDMLWNQKKRHYFIYSWKSNYGKTTFLNQLEQLYPCARYQVYQKQQEKFQADSRIVLMDEYSYIDSEKLFLMCDGKYYYPQKYKSPVNLKCPILIIASEQDPSYFYKMNEQPNLDKFNKKFDEPYDVNNQQMIDKQENQIINVVQSNYSESKQSESDHDESQFNSMIRQQEFQSSQNSMEEEQEI